ncbi:hypothetical protein HK101_001440 [Irineochytrium annulatum]|nr:hypothetical protein HK101_001440 [Irineochytrium annulatum]
MYGSSSGSAVGNAGGNAGTHLLSSSAPVRSGFLSSGMPFDNRPPLPGSGGGGAGGGAGSLLLGGGAGGQMMLQQQIQLQMQHQQQQQQQQGLGGGALSAAASSAAINDLMRLKGAARFGGGGGGGGEGDGRGGGVGGAMRSADSEATEVPQVKGVGGGREAMGKSAVNLGSSGSGAVREAGVGSTPAFVTSLHGGTPSSTTTRDGATGSATTPYTASPAGSNEKDDAMLPTSTAASPRNRTRRVFSAVAGGDPRMRLSMPPSDLPPCVRERLDAMRCEGVSSPTSSIRSTGGRARVPGAAGGGSLRASPKRRDTTTSCDGKRWSVGERSMTWEDGVGRVAGTPSWRARGASVFGAEFEGFEEVDGESVGGGGRWMGALGTLVPMTAPGTPEARAARAEGYVEPTERAMEEMPDFSNAGKKVVR